MNKKKVRLGNICKKILSGGTPSTENASFWNGSIPWVTSADITGNFSITPKKYITEKANANILPAGNILVVTRVGLGKVSANDSDLAFSQDIQGLIISENVDIPYLVYCLSQKVQNFKTISRGATIKGVTRDDLVNIEIPLPDLPTQKHIASILDKADALRQQNRQLLNYYDELLQSTFIEMFGDPVRNSKNWKVLNLESICKKITDGTHFSPPSVDSGIPYITAKHVKKHGLDFYSDPTFVSQDEHDKIFARCSPSKGDVLYIKDGATTGIAAINEYDFEFSMLSSLALIKVNDKLLVNRYLVSWLNHEKVKRHLLGEFMSGAAIQRFTLTKIKSFKIPVPPIKLQEEFAEISLRIETDKKVISQALVNSLDLFNGLQACIFKN